MRENAGLVYYVGVSLEAGQTRSVYTLDYACDPASVSKARSLAVANLKAMRDSEVTPAELRQAKALLLRQIPLSESSVERIAQGWIDRSLHGLPLDEPTAAAHRYNDLTAAQVQAAWSKWLRPDDLVQITLGPAGK
jgi:zinc protease